jgi:hypothetical protein
MSQHHRKSTALSTTPDRARQLARSAAAELRARQSSANAERRQAIAELSDRSPEGRRSSWSYYVFDQGLRTLCQPGRQQRIWIDGISEAIVLESQRGPW